MIIIKNKNTQNMLLILSMLFLIIVFYLIYKHTKDPFNDLINNSNIEPQVKIIYPKYTDLSPYPCQIPSVFNKNMYKFKNKGKLAFLFLLKNDLQFTKLWDLFFKNIDKNLYVILVHFSDYNVKIKLPFDYIKVNTVKTKWGDVYNAENELFKHILKMNNIFGSVFISNNCLPLKTFNQIYNKLSNSETSILNFNREDVSWMSQWCFLIKKDIKILVKHSNEYQKIVEKSNNKNKSSNATEEIFPPYILKQYSDKLTHGVITFDCWNPEKIKKYSNNINNNKFLKTTPVHFTHIDKLLLDNLINRDICFIRKFDINTKVITEFKKEINIQDYIISKNFYNKVHFTNSINIGNNKLKKIN